MNAFTQLAARALGVEAARLCRDHARDQARAAGLHAKRWTCARVLCISSTCLRSKGTP
jgi:hypothetical protein